MGDMYGIEGDKDKPEGTSNKAYFYRHFMAEAREKKFYEELFETRTKQQQILEKRKTKKEFEENKMNEFEQNDIDLMLPTLPKGPWSFKLGPEYDKTPVVPQIVTNRPQFNYQHKIGMEWKMPSHLIRRTDYGNMGNIIIKTENTKITKKKQQIKCKENKNNMQKNKGLQGLEGKKKQELIQLYQRLKRMKKS